MEQRSSEQSRMEDILNHLVLYLAIKCLPANTLLGNLFKFTVDSVFPQHCEISGPFQIYIDSVLQVQLHYCPGYLEIDIKSVLQTNFEEPSKGGLPLAFFL